MSGIVFDYQESFDFYGTYLHPFYRKSILHFKRDYYAECLENACMNDDTARVHEYTVRLKKAQEQLLSISEPAIEQ